jgi:predicted dehydrogenase
MDLTRRQLVGGAAALAGAQTIALAQRKVGPNDRIHIGFIGIGIQGSSHLRMFHSMSGVQVVAAADLYDGHLKAAKELTTGEIATTRDYREVLARPDVDAVVIATPEHWHKRITLDALAAGKHVYCEKPLTYSIEEGPEVVAAAERSDRLVMVGSQGKTSASTAVARQIVKSGKLGKVTMIRVGQGRNDPEGAWQYPIPPDASPETVDWKRFLGTAPARKFDPSRFFRWRCWWDYSGGVSTDLMVHDLTTLHEIMDVTAPKSATSHGGIYRWKDGRDVPDMLSTTLEYPQGFAIEMYVTLNNGHPARTLEILGTEGSLVSERQGFVFYPEPTPPKAQSYGANGWPKDLRAQYYESLGYAPDGKPKDPPAMRKQPETIEVNREGALRHQDYFVQSIREGAPSRESARDGHHAAAAAHLVNLAYRMGRRLQYNATTNQVTEA